MCTEVFAAGWHDLQVSFQVHVLQKNILVAPKHWIPQISPIIVGYIAAFDYSQKNSLKIFNHTVILESHPSDMARYSNKVLVPVQITLGISV